MKLMSRGRRVNVFWKRTYVLVCCLKKSPIRANQNLKNRTFLNDSIFTDEIPFKSGSVSDENKIENP